MSVNLLLESAQLDVLIRPEDDARIPRQRVPDTLQAISTPHKSAMVRILKETCQITSSWRSLPSTQESFTLLSKVIALCTA